LEYELEAESNVGSALSTPSLPIPPSLTPSSFSSPPPSYKMSQQPDYSTIIRQLQEQITTLSKQVAGRAGGEAVGLEVVKPQVFDGTPLKVLGFVTACKLYGKAKMRGGACGRTDPVGVIICIRRSGRHMERECVGGIGGRRIRI